MKNNKKSNFQGEVVPMISPMGSDTARDTFDYEDNFYPMDGFMEESEGGKDDTFSQFDFGAIFGANKAERQRRRKLREKLKQQEADTNAKLAANLANDTSSTALANALASSGSSVDAPPTKKGLSTNAKIGIGLGIAALIGVVIYLKRKHKK
jgi:hypothetical protein